MKHNTRSCLNQLFEAKQTLWSLGVLRSERLTGEIGEYIVGSLHGYRRALSSSNKGWDLQSECGKKIQVKAHAKGFLNGYRATMIKNFDRFDSLSIVVMEPDYRIKSIYEIPSEQAKMIAKPRAGGDFELPWRLCEEFQVTHQNHPHPIWEEIGVV